MMSRFRVSAAVSAFALCLCASAWAQNFSTISGPVSIVPLEPVTVTLGHETQMAITVRIQDGYHINSNKPLSTALKPTQLHVSLPETLILMQTQYPTGKLTDSPFEPPGEKLSLYTGEVTIKTMVRARAKSMLGGYTVHAELEYQACDNKACYPPKMVPFEFMVNVVKPPKEPK
jgi:DsbC/DsbD-like thiol-disulfide interchange protein